MKIRSYVVLAAAWLALAPAAPALGAPGDLDSTFGSGGIVKTAIGTANDAYAWTLLQQPDGKLVAAGEASNSAPGGFALARYNSNGGLDTAFGNAGTVITAVGGQADYCDALVLQPDGKLVAVGQVYNGSSDDFGLVRYNSDGSLDTSFGTGGKVVTSISSGDDDPFALVLQPDGKLVAGGNAAATYSASGSPVTGDFALARYNADGSLDTSFGSGGTVITPIGSDANVNGLVVLPSGKLVAGGWAQLGANYEFALARYNADGTLDTTFGNGGTVTVPIAGGGTDDEAVTLLVQPDGRLVAAGRSVNSTTGSIDYSIGPLRRERQSGCSIRQRRDGHHSCWTARRHRRRTRPAVRREIDRRRPVEYRHRRHCDLGLLTRRLQP